VLSQCEIEHYEEFNCFLANGIACFTNSYSSLWKLVVRNTVTILLVQVVMCVYFYRSIVAGSDGKGSGVFNPSQILRPVTLECKNFSKILSSKQKTVCEIDKKLLSCTAIGILQALNQCHKLFKNRPWNCSVFPNTRAHYLGQFVETGVQLIFVLLS